MVRTEEHGDIIYVTNYQQVKEEVMKASKLFTQARSKEVNVSEK